MIIARYLNKEVFKAMLVVLIVLLLLFIGQRFVQYLTDVAQGHISSELVSKLLLLQIPVFVSYLLPLSLFLAILISLGKLHTDSEMTIISACGISNRQVLRYFMPLVFILTVLTGYLTLFQAPFAIYAQQQLIKEQEIKGDLSLLTAGHFQQTADGKKIIYVENITNDNLLEGIFFVEQNNEKDYQFSLIVSDKGRYWNDESQQNFLILENGNQYRGSPGSSKLQTVEFERYFMALKKVSRNVTERKIKGRSTLELLTDLTLSDQAELQWRLAAPLSIPLLVLLALPLARVPPRQGKFAQLLPGLLIYIIYMILLITARNAIENAKILPWMGTWWIHLALLGYGISEFTHRKWLRFFIFKTPKKEAIR